MDKFYVCMYLFIYICLFIEYLLYLQLTIHNYTLYIINIYI